MCWFCPICWQNRSNWLFNFRIELRTNCKSVSYYKINTDMMFIPHLMCLDITFFESIVESLILLCLSIKCCFNLVQNALPYRANFKIVTYAPQKVGLEMVFASNQSKSTLTSWDHSSSCSNICYDLPFFLL